MRAHVVASLALMAGFLVGNAASAQVVQKPALYFSGSNEQHGASFTEKLQRRLSVVYAVNPEAPRRWGVSVHVLNPYQSPIIYSVTLLDSCGERWCWRTTYTGTCRATELDGCADRLFDIIVETNNAG